MKFKVGDVCVTWDNPNTSGTLTRYVAGSEVTITGIYLGGRHVGCTAEAYFVDGQNDWYICGCCLKLKRPPDHLHVIPWSECIWKPAGIVA